MKAKSNNKKQQKKKIVLTTLAVGAAGILGYFGWQYYKKRKDKNNSEPEVSFKKTAAEESSPSYVDTPVFRPAAKPKTKLRPQAVNQNPYLDIPAAAKNDFPLKRGSKGEKVRALQEALIAKYGKQILPRYGADGDFGPEMTAALKKAKLPATISQSTYNVLVQTNKANSSDGVSMAKQIFVAASKRDFDQTVQLLKQLQSKDDYRQASDEFKNYRLNGGVRQTLVNGLLNTFSKEDQKQAIRFEFLRMGLQFDGNKWSLSGFDGVSIITIEPATVWVNSTETIQVPAKMVLGNEVSKRLDYTLFENNGKHFLVQTKSIQPL
jgi:peptidoglycan hydrolase-like protein with peptidoglycan-binding domain